MKQSLVMFCLIALLVGVIDLVVAAGLGWAEPRGKLGSLVRYFDYGRSVPGKIDRWQQANARRFDFGWMPAILASSQENFAGADADNGADAAPAIRSYGMSFVNHIMVQAKQVRPELLVDLHSGPAGPPNFTYALSLDDAANRRPGDVVVLGILSSSVPAMAALSNRSWAFEQPLPFTYPIFRPEDGGPGLRRIDPVIATADDERTLTAVPSRQAAWAQQLAREDAFYSQITFGAAWSDASPFARMVRRSLAKGHVKRTEAAILDGAFPYDEVLRRMVTGFADRAKQEGEIPIVMLIQTGDPGDADLLALLQTFLEEHAIAYFATAEHFDPREPSGFIADGHYTTKINQQFAAAFLDRLEGLLEEHTQQ